MACGSFSPVTFLHLRLFGTALIEGMSPTETETEQARDWLSQNEPDVVIIGGYLSPVSDAYGKKVTPEQLPLLYCNAHLSQDLAPAPHRVAMCELGTRDSDWIMTDSWESQQKEYQRTVVVLEHFHHQLNEHLKARYNKEVRAMFLCGADLVESFAKPGVWAEDDVRS